MPTVILTAAKSARFSEIKSKILHLCSCPWEIDISCDCQAHDSFEILMNFANDLTVSGTMNFAVRSSWPMMQLWVVISPHKNELPAVIPAEGPIFCVGLDHK